MEHMDFDKAKWIGKRLGECPSADARGDEKAFLKEQKAKTDEGVPEFRSLLARRTITISKPLFSAIAHVVGVGFYEFYINGIKVDDRRLAPCYVDFNRRVPYHSIDVKDLLKPGKNALSFEIANGWFVPHPRFNDWRTYFYGNKRMILQLELVYADGSTETVCSDEQFRLADGPVINSTIYDGEQYDARLEIPGWKLPDFDDSKWQSAVEVEAPSGVMTRDDAEPIRVVAAAEPERVWNNRDGKIVCAFAENLTGNLRVLVSGPRGAEVRFRFSENINPDGTLNTKTNNRAFNEDVYILKGESTECIDPRFTYHCFRYAEISLSDPSTRIISILQQNIRTDLPVTGKFTCDDEIVNELHRVFVRTQLNCLVDVPLDCPQRDERLGWLGDAYATAQTVIYNFNANKFYRRYLQQISDSQTEPGAIPIIVPRPDFDVEAFDYAIAFPVFYQYMFMDEGDTAILNKYYDQLMKLCEYVLSKSDGYEIMPVFYGDWTSSFPGFKQADPHHLSQYMFCWMTDILIDAASRIGREEDIPKLRKYHDGAAEIVLKEDYDRDGHFFRPDCPCTNAFALYCHLLPVEEESAVLEHLIADIHAHNNSLLAGIFGFKIAFEVLEQFGRQDVMLEILRADQFPGYRNMLRGGKSTLTETWTCGGTGCHAMFDSPDSYLYTSFAGIRVDHRQKNWLTVEPWCSEALGSVSASIETVHGKVSVIWQKTDFGYGVSIDIPDAPGAIFRLHPSLKGSQVFCNGKSADESFQLPAGHSYVEIRI